MFTPRQLTPSELAATSYDLTPQQEAGFRQAVAEVAPASLTRLAKVAAIEQARTAAIATQREKADAARLAIEAKDRATFQTNQDEQAKFDRENAAKNAAAAEAARQKQAEIEATGAQTRLTAKDQVQNDASRKLVEDMNTETTAARGRVGSLEAVLELSRNVENPTILATKTFQGVPLVDLLKNFGIGSEAFQNKLSAIQALRSGLANVTKAMRQGVALGNASDADMRFITAMGPSELEDHSTREAIVANLLGQQYRTMRFNTEVQKLISNGMKPGEAIDAANKTISPVTPALPKELKNAPRGDPRVKEWFDSNVPANTIWADADGRRHVYHSPDWKPPVPGQ